MNTNPRLHRGLQLLAQSRYELAEQEFEQVLADDPDNSFAHGMLGICLAKRGSFQDASREVELAISLDPELPFAFYAQSVVLAERNQFSEAETAIEQAIGLDPYQPDFFAQLASVHLQQRHWQAAHDAAHQGLELDPEDVACTNLRAMALVQLGERIEAKQAIQTALKRDPEDAGTHANMGWSLLEAGQPEPAMVHFREALRLDPESNWARHGIVEAMKAKHFLYRIILGWFLWMLKLSGRAQWGVMIGGYFAYRILQNVAANQPALAPWLMPLLIAYVTFAIATWVASPLFNLVLRFDRFGRLVLSREELVTSNWVGLCLLGALISLGAYFISGAEELLGCALAAGLMIPSLGAIYACDEGWPRVSIILITIALGGLALVLVLSCLSARFLLNGLQANAMSGVAIFTLTVFIYAAIASQFAANWLAAAKPRKDGVSQRKAWGIGLCALAAGAMLFYSNLSNSTPLSTALFGPPPEPQVFTLPIRIQLVPQENLVWKHADRLDEITSTLERLGFDTLGDFGTKEIQDHKHRVLFKQDEAILVELTENPQLAFHCEFSTCYDDGTIFCCNDDAEDPLQDHPALILNHMPQASAAELYQQLLAKRPTAGIRTVQPNELIDLIQDSYAREVEFLLERRGPTAEEFRALGLRVGRELDDKQIAAAQHFWRKQASLTVNEFVLNEFRERPREANQLTETDREHLLCIHDLMDEKTLLELVFLKFYANRETPKLSTDQLQELGRIVQKQKAREAFAKITQWLPDLKKLDTVRKPIPADIYLLNW